MLEQADLSSDISEEEYDKKLPLLQSEMFRLSQACYRKKIPVIMVYEGWDAAGKGGNIKRVTAKVDPRGYSVIPIGKPTEEELNHHYLWRFWRHLPESGRLTVFDRSWYGRVLVERVEKITPEEDWQRAYQEINEFESQLCEFGTVLFKFWVHISPEEQLKRFEERKANPFKAYKLTDEDWRNREKWEEYRLAAEEMFRKTSTIIAPWHIIPGNSKKFARINTLEIITDRLKKEID